jgi:hypothetical protein
MVAVESLPGRKQRLTHRLRPAEYWLTVSPPRGLKDRRAKCLHQDPLIQPAYLQRALCLSIARCRRLIFSNILLVK